MVQLYSLTKGSLYLHTQSFIDKRALNIAEAAQYACVSRGTIEHWLSTKLLPFEELPSHGRGRKRFLRIRQVDLDKFLNAHYCIQSKDRRVEEHEELTLLPKS